MWLLNYITCVWILKGHSAFVSDIALVAPGIIASCSRDKTVKTWNVDLCECLLTIKTNKGPLSCVIKLDNYTIAAADWDEGNVFILDRNKGYCLHTIKADPQQVICMKAMDVTSPDDRILVWCYGCTVWNYLTGEKC